MAFTLMSCAGLSNGLQADAEAAVVEAFVGIMTGDVDALLDFASDDCFDDFSRADARVEAEEIFAQLGAAKLNIESFDITATAERFDGKTAEILVTITSPQGISVDDTLSVKFENDRWVSTICDDIADLAPQESIEDPIVPLGRAGSAGDPIPLGVGAPVGLGMTVSLDALVVNNPSSADPFEDAESSTDDLLISGLGPCGSSYGATFTFANLGFQEPLAIVGWSISAVDRQTGATYDGYNCGRGNDLNGGRKMFVGAVYSGDLWFDVPNPVTFDGQFRIESFVDGTTIFFDPIIKTESPQLVIPVRGSNPNATLHAERSDPKPMGTTVDVGYNWEIVIVSANLDAFDTSAGPDYPPPADGVTYIQVVAEVTYRSDQDPAFLPLPNSYGISDANISAVGCSVDGFVTNRLIESAILRPTISNDAVTVTACYAVANEDVDSFMIYIDGQHPHFLAVR